MYDARLNDLAEIKKLAIVCDDCGRRRVWRANEIALAQVRYSVHSTVQLGTRLMCKACEERGQKAHNVSLYVDAVEDSPVGEIPI